MKPFEVTLATGVACTCESPEPSIKHMSWCPVFDAACIPIACPDPKCKTPGRSQLVDPYHPYYADFVALPEPRTAKCSTCALQRPVRAELAS